MMQTLKKFHNIKFLMLAMLLSFSTAKAQHLIGPPYFYFDGTKTIQGKMVNGFPNQYLTIDATGKNLKFIDLVTTNSLTTSGKNLVSVVNGITSSTDLTSIVAASSTNLLTLSGVNLTSTVNGIASSVDFSPAFDNKENKIAAGTIAQYWRGDKTWQTLDKAAVGLSNVSNTADADKPVSTDQQAALDTKVDKVTGKGLSTEDYTTAEKTKLAGIEAGAQKNVNAIVKVVNAHTVADTDYTILANATSGAFTLTLPAANASAGRVLIIRKTDESANVLTFSSAIKISETTSFTTLNINTTIRIQSDGTAWYKID